MTEAEQPDHARMSPIVWSIFDWVIPLFACSVVFLWSWHRSGKLVPLTRDTMNTYFQADTERVYYGLSTRYGGHERGHLHPLFGLLCGVPVILASKIGGIDPILAIRSLLASAAAFWFAGQFFLLRLIGLARLDSLIIAVLAAVSASAMFWFPVAETFPFAASSILFPLVVLAIGRRYPIADGFTVAGIVLSCGITITNGVTGLLVAGLRHPLKIYIKLSCVAILILFVLGSFSHTIIPYRGPNSFDLRNYHEEKRYMRSLDAESLATMSRAFFFHSMLMPEIGSARDAETHRLNLSIEKSPAGSSGLLAKIGLVAWIGLLGFGILGCTTSKVDRTIRACVILLIGFQFCLHAAYGEETFLYSLHFTPLMVTLVGMACLSRLRTVILILTLILIPCAAINNSMMLDRAISLVRTAKANPLTPLNLQ